MEAIYNKLVEIANNVEQGETDPLVAYAEIKKLEKEVSRLKGQIEPIAMESASNFGAKSFEHQGFKFELRNGATRYSFKNISIWQEKSQELKDIEKKAKSAYKAKLDGIMTATEDGEEIELPEVSYNKDSLVVK